jgi:ADP-ribose pyrophosphatase YjhB (NUDIX family)
VRAQAVILDGDRILLVRHVSPGREYWVLPGGAVEPGETVQEATVREVREETGLCIDVERLLFIDEPRCAGGVTFSEPRHTYLGRVVGGELLQIEDQDGARGDKGYLRGAEWLPFDAPCLDESTRDTLELVRSALARAAGTL